MTILEKIDFLMNEKRLNKRQLSITSGIPYSTINNLWVRGSDSMRLPTFRALCNFFNVTMDSMAWDDREIEYKSDKHPDSLSREEQELIKDYESLDTRGRGHVIDTVRSEKSYVEGFRKDSGLSELKNA